MKRGQKITIERTQSGCYSITGDALGKASTGEPIGQMVGGAASTIITLSHLIFMDEASGDMIKEG